MQRAAVSSCSTNAGQAASTSGSVDTDRFTQTATDPAAWLRKSRQLRHSGDVLWDRCFDDFIRLLAEAHQQGRELTPDEWENVEGQLYGAQFMYALALETAFKARILRDDPGNATIELIAGPDGRPTGAEIRRVGVTLKQGHNLEALAEAAGAFDRTRKPLFASDSDYFALREILRHLADVLRWSGRYPVPRKSTEHYRKPSELPGRVLGHYLRDWIDDVFKAYHSYPAP